MEKVILHMMFSDSEERKMLTCGSFMSQNKQAADPIGMCKSSPVGYNAFSYPSIVSNLSLQDAYMVGVGSGSTVVYAVERLGKFCCCVRV